MKNEKKALKASYVSYLKANFVTIICLCLIVFTNIHLQTMIKKSYKDLSYKLDCLENGVGVLGRDGDASLLPQIALDELWSEYGIPVDITNESTQIPTYSKMEHDIIASTSKISTHILEIGTGDGSSALIMAKSSPNDANVYTIDLPTDTNSIIFTHGDSPALAALALKERTHDKYKYENTDHHKKITQIFADTKNFDETQFVQKLDFIFIDGASTYSYVKNDTQKALNMIKPGGIIIWRNYDNKRQDVPKFINEFGQKNKLHHIKGTSLVIHKAV